MTLEQLYAERILADPDLNQKLDDFSVLEKLETGLTYPQKFLYFLWNFTRKAVYPNEQTA